MIDIERKSLKYLEANLTNLSRIKDNNAIKEEIFSSKTHITKWDSCDRLFLYIEIMTEIISQNKMVEINAILRVCPILEHVALENKENDLFMFYSVLLNFYNFFKKIYTIYLLDQFKYLLTSQSISLPSKTDSYYEQINYGLDNVQLGLNSDLTDKFDIYIYNIKKSYLDFFTKYLSNNEYRKRYYNLINHLKELQKAKPSYFISDLLSVISKEITIQKSMTRTKKLKKDKDQISLF